MTILGIDMGWSKSVSCLIDSASNQRRYETIGTNRASFEALITRLHPDRVVIEAGPMAGWVHDLCRRLKQELLVLNTNDEAWQWSKVKRKSDRRDALKIARMAMLDGISRAVHVPEHAVRQWRQLIAYRTKVKRQSPKRKKQAIVAAARHLGIWAWAMDRDQVDFTPPAASKALAELRAKQARQMAEGRSSKKTKRRQAALAAEQEREAERNETAEMATTV